MDKEIVTLDKDSVSTALIKQYDDLQNWELIGVSDRELISTALKESEFLPTGMSAYQIKNFVLKDQNFPTPDSKFWQCRLEMWVRMQSVAGSYYLFTKIQAELEILEGELEQWNSWWRKLFMNKKVLSGNVKKKIVEIKEKEFNLMTIGKGAAEALREMGVFRGEFEELKEHIKHNPEDKESQEMEVWLRRAIMDPRLQAMITRKSETHKDI